MIQDEERMPQAEAFFAARVPIAIEPREYHAADLASWPKVLKNDKPVIFQAAAHAERAMAFLHGLQKTAVNRPDWD